MHPINMTMMIKKMVITLSFWLIDQMQLVFLFPRFFVHFLVALLRISSFSCSFQAFLFPAIKMQSSMVLWVMVNCRSVSIVVKILNKHCTGLFEEGIAISSSANKQIFRNYLRQYTKIFSHISWYSRFGQCFFGCCLKWALFDAYFLFLKTWSLQRIGEVLNEGFILLQTINRAVSQPELEIKSYR